MCGICGLYRPTGLREGDERVLDSMIQALRHRGPDGAGAWSDDHVAFGHTRLAIIDLEGGAQPMIHRPSGAALVFNGEIYNYQELRRELQAAGDAFITASDTEVLLKGLLRHGDRFLDRLEGMFAFAFWQPSRRELLLARDRYGEKPLYFHRTDAGAVAFASELKCLAQRAIVEPRIRTDVVAEYLLYRDVLAPETLLEDISEVPAATCIVVSPQTFQERRFWQLESTFAVNPREPVDIVDTTEQLLQQSISRRLVADVPVGAITSGGLDSSLVSAIACKSSAAPLHTFCVGFEERDYDESDDAATMAAHIGSVHHAVMVSQQDVEQHLDSLTWVHDLPLTHPNAIPMHLVFRYAREEAGVTVVLSGEGADEVFGGYDWYRVMTRREGLLPLRHILRLTGRVLPGDRGRTLGRVMSDEYPLVASAVIEPDSLGPFSVSATRALEKRNRIPTIRGSALDATFLRDQWSYLPALLRRQDRMAMAAGVEARVVFLDRDLVTFVNPLTGPTKLANGRTKAILREIGDRWLPPQTLAKKKVGFTLPLGRWFGGSGRLAERLRELDGAAGPLRDGTFGFVVPPTVRIPDDVSLDMAWSLLALVTWYELLVTSSRNAAPSSGAQRAGWRAAGSAKVLEQ
jgi:asparagine synthase (glutamine-hydrolysing)